MRQALLIPISGIAEIALSAVQVSVPRLDVFPARLRLKSEWGHSQLLSVSRLLWALRRVRLSDQGTCGESAFIATTPQAIAKLDGEN